jgi:CRP-like cAMP-binding protein
MTYSTSEYLDLEDLGSASNFVEEIVQVVERLSLFEGFNPDECRQLCEYMVCFGARKNVNLLTEGTAGDFLMIILTGQVDVVKAGCDNPCDNKLVAHIGPGGLLGEMSMVDGLPRSASCVTTQPTDFAVLTRHKLNAVMEDHPKLGSKLLLLLLQLMSGRLRDATARMLPSLAGAAV